MGCNDRISENSLLNQKKKKRNTAYPPTHLYYKPGALEINTNCMLFVVLLTYYNYA